MKTIIVYYSFSGNNKALALKLQQKLQCDIHEITEVKKRNGFTILFDLLFKRTPEIIKSEISFASYDCVILSSPIWAGRLATPMSSFLRLEGMHCKSYAFMTICGSGKNPKLADELTKLCGKKALDILELKTTDLLPPDKQNSIKYTSGYRIQKQDLLIFEKALDHFLQTIPKAHA